MAVIRNLRKLADWRKRLDKFRSSGLTVTQFCRLEGVSTTTFYYWEKRVQQGPHQAAIEPVERVRSDGSRGSGQLRKLMAKQRGLPSNVEQAMKTDHVHLPAGDQLMLSEPRVNFTFNSKLHVSVPANCVQALHCVLEWCAREGAEHSTHAAGPASSFQQVLVGSR